MPFTESSYALDKAGCISEANNHDKSGSAAKDCEYYGDSARGTLYFSSESGEIPESESPSTNFNVYIRGGVFSGTKTSYYDMTANHIYALTSSYKGGKPSNQTQSDVFVNLSSLTVKRARKSGQSAHTWNWSSDKQQATVNSSKFWAVASKNSSIPGLYRTTVHLYRCPNTSPSDSCYTTETYVPAYKIARVDDKFSITVNGSSASNGETIKLPVGTSSAQVSFSHKLYRKDGWTSLNPSATTKYTISDAVPSQTNVELTGTNEVALPVNTRTVNNIPTGEKNAVEVCSTLTYYEIIGLDGYSAMKNQKSKKICVKVYQAEPDYKSVSELSKVSFGAGKVKSNETTDNTLSIRRDSGVSSYTFHFTHNLSVPETFTDATMSYKIHRTVRKNGSITEDKDIIVESNKANFFNSQKNVNIRSGDVKLENLSGSDTAKVCETVTYSPTRFTIASGKAIDNNGEAKTAREVCGEITAAEAQETEIESKTTATVSARYLTPENASASAKFHFSHKFRNKDSNNKYADLTTSYHISRTVTVTKNGVKDESRSSSYDVSGYTSSDGKTYTVAHNSDYSGNSPISYEFNYTVYEGETVEICDTIHYSPKKFSFMDDGSSSGSSISSNNGKSTACATTSKPSITWEKVGDITITGTTDAFAEPTSSDSSVDSCPGGFCTIRGNNISVQFTHTLTRSPANPDTADNLSISESITEYYKFGASSSFNTNDYTNLAKPSRTGESVSKLIDEDARDVASVGLGTAGQQTYCSNIYFKSSFFVLEKAFATLDGAHINETVYGTRQRSEPTSPEPVGNSAERCLTFFRPYNFKLTSLKNTKFANEVVTPNSEVSVKYDVNISKYNPNADITYIPDASIRLFRFTLDANTPKEINLDGAEGVADPYNYIYSKVSGYLIGNIMGNADDDPYYKQHHEFRNTANGTPNTTNHYSNINDYSTTYAPSSAVVVPSIENGQKFCIALAVSPLDSGAGRSSDDFNRQWIVSNFSCANAGKKPTMQVWGGNVFTEEGGINTSTTVKVKSETIEEVVHDSNLPNHKIFLIVDRSGSMASVISQFKVAGVKIAKQFLSAGAKVSIYSFYGQRCQNGSSDNNCSGSDYDNSTAKVQKHCSFTECNSASAIQSSANTISTSGTPLASGSSGKGSEKPLSAALKAFEQEQAAGNISSGDKITFLLITDAGIDNANLEAIKTLSLNNGKINLFFMVTSTSTYNPPSRLGPTEDSKFCQNKVVANCSYQQILNSQDYFNILEIYNSDNTDIYDLIQETATTTIVTTTNILSKNLFGSWGDFALISRGKINASTETGMASGAALSGGTEDFKNSRQPTICSYSPLTIANEKCLASTTSVDSLGESTASHSRNLYSELKTRYIGDSDFQNTGFEDSRVSIPAGANYKIVESDHYIIYYSSGDIQIKSNITDDNNYSNINDVNQVIILANNININENVTRLDAELVASNNINTCTGHNTDNLNSDTCNKSLTINGPVYSSSLTLPRTFGGDPSIDESGDRALSGLDSANGSLNSPAERLDYNPLSILWGYAQSTKEKIPNTVYLKKLAPRY